jgi:hypothetical protein
MTPTPVTIRHVTKSDSAVWLELRRALWPENGGDSLTGEVAQFFTGEIKNLLACCSLKTMPDVSWALPN